MGSTLLGIEARDDSHDAFYEKATSDAVRTEAELPPDDQQAEQALSEIVGGQLGPFKEARRSLAVRKMRQVCLVRAASPATGWGGVTKTVPFETRQLRPDQ